MTDQPTDTAPPPEAQETEREQEALTIREFLADDIDGLFFLEQRCYEAPLAMTYVQLRGLLKDPSVATLVVVGETGDAPRMAAALVVKREPEQQRLMIISLMVDPDYRRLGLGRRLAEHAQRVASAVGLASVAMPVEAENAVGSAFLKAQGYLPAEQSAPYFVAPEDGSLWCLTIAAPSTPVTAPEESP